MVTRLVWIHWKVTGKGGRLTDSPVFSVWKFRAGHSKSTIRMVSLSCVACCHSLLELVGVGGEDHMVFQFLCAFSTLKSHHLPNSLPNFVFFHLFFPLYCTACVGVAVFYLREQNFNLQKKWFQPIQSIFHWKKMTQILQILKKKWNPNHQIFIISSNR